MDKNRETSESFYVNYTAAYVSRWALISMVGLVIAFIYGFFVSPVTQINASVIIAGSVAGLFFVYSLMKTICLAYPMSFMATALLWLAIISLMIYSVFKLTGLEGDLTGDYGYRGWESVITGSLIAFTLLFSIMLKVKGFIKGWYNIVLLLSLGALLIFVWSLVAGSGSTDLFRYLARGLTTVVLFVVINGIRVRTLTFI